MPLKATIVFTTIFDPIVLDSYYENLERFGHLDQTDVIVIPDRKTPPEAYATCARVAKKGLKVQCPTIQEQEAFLQSAGLPAKFVPYDSDNRRNVGYLMALASGSDFVISIDDDNYCRQDSDCFEAHAVVTAGPRPAKVVNSSTGWFNICSMMEMDQERTPYPRGYPYYARHARDEKITATESSQDVHVNAGLWLGDPDVDAISWLVAPSRATALKETGLVLGDRAWSPVNTQNTGLRRDALVAYYFVKMNYPLGGLSIDRYGDIFSGYFVQACTRHVGGAVRVGTPAADHRRNSHNYLRDAGGEWACILMLNDLLPWLTQELKLDGRTYADAYESLSHQMESAVERLTGPIWTDATRGYFHQTAYCMRTWIEACRRLSS